MPAFKRPESVLVVVHTADGLVLLLEIRIGSLDLGSNNVGFAPLAQLCQDLRPP